MRPFAIFCAAVVAGFTAMEVLGVDLLPAPPPPAAPASVRGTSGGSRVFRTGGGSSGGGGFRGGK